MCEKIINNYSLSSGDDTDSTDEVFVFTQKRKASSFFIDLTDEEAPSKKPKNDTIGQECDVQDIDCSKIKIKKQLPEDSSDIEIVNFVPGDSSKVKSAVNDVAVEKLASVNPSPVIKVPIPQLKSPPPVVRVTTALSKKSRDVIDLTDMSESKEKKWRKEEIQNEGNGAFSPDEPNESSQGLGIDDYPQNQLGDKKCAEMYDADWYGKVFY